MHSRVCCADVPKARFGRPVVRNGELLSAAACCQGNLSRENRELTSGTVPLYTGSGKIAAMAMKSNLSALALAFTLSEIASAEPSKRAQS